jgi:fumarate reductase flavoprotein subunit
MKINKIDDINADIAIIGSGGGLTAALAAAEKGAKNVVVIEKQTVPGGSTRLAGDIFACESPVQQRADIKTGRDEYFKIAMRWAHWDRVDPRIVRAYINKTGDTIQWLEEKGVEFEDISPDRGITTHNAVGSNRQIYRILVKKCEELGVKILVGTNAKKILRDDRGKINGVEVINKSDEEFSITTKSVIIATGSFPGNIELLKKYCPEYYDGMQLGKWPFHTGDGLIMASEIGAGIADSIPMFHIGPVLEGGYWSKLAFLPYQPYLIWVNRRGRRFIDESWPTHWESGNAVMNQPDKTVYLVWDKKINDDLELSVHDFADGFKKLVGEDEAKTALDLDEIARWIGSEATSLKGCVAEYNSGCSKGYDEVFAKERRYLMPIQKAPYYAVRAIAHCGETMGGIKVNERMEVLDRSGNLIPGLFAAGVITDGWMGQTYCTDMFGSACSYALNSGRIAGESAADFVIKKFSDQNSHYPTKME